MSDIPPGDRWGPFASGLDPAERLARTRLLRGLTHVLLGERGADLCHALLITEGAPAWGSVALACLDALASLDRRKVLATYGSISCAHWRT